MLCLSGFELYSRWVPCIMALATIEQKDNLLQQKTLSIQDSEDCFLQLHLLSFQLLFFR